MTDLIADAATMNGLGRALLLALLISLGLPYALVVALNCTFGWPTSRPDDGRYLRALRPARVRRLSYAAAQQVGGLLRYVPVYLRLRWFYSRAVTVTKDIEYGRNGNTLDLWRPSEARARIDSPCQLADGNKPVLVFVYGGAWSTGDKSLYGLLAQTLADRLGTLVCIPNYSLYPKGVVTDMTEDLEDALAWLKSSELVRSLGGDPERVALCGHSAGGHLAALLVIELAGREPGETKPAAKSSAKSLANAASANTGRVVDPPGLLSSVRAVVGIGGVYHIMDHYGHEARRGVEDVSAMWRATGGLANFDWHSPGLRLAGLDHRQLARLPPFVLVHGTRDDVVPPSASQRFATALGEHGVPVSLALVQGGGHADLVVAVMEEGRPFHDHMVSLMQDKLQGPLTL